MLGYPLPARWAANADDEQKDGVEAGEEVTAPATTASREVSTSTMVTAAMAAATAGAYTRPLFGST